MVARSVMLGSEYGMNEMPYRETQVLHLESAAEPTSDLITRHHTHSPQLRHYPAYYFARGLHSPGSGVTRWQRGSDMKKLTLHAALQRLNITPL